MLACLHASGRERVNIVISSKFCTTVQTFVIFSLKRKNTLCNELYRKLMVDYGGLSIYLWSVQFVCTVIKLTVGPYQGNIWWSVNCMSPILDTDETMLIKSHPHHYYNRLSVEKNYAIYFFIQLTSIYLFVCLLSVLATRPRCFAQSWWNLLQNILRLLGSKSSSVQGTTCINDNLWQLAEFLCSGCFNKDLPRMYKNN